MENPCAEQDLSAYYRKEVDKFTYKTYKCVWVTEVFQTDDQGFRNKQPPFYYKEWPTSNLAYDDLKNITIEEVHGSWIRFRYPQAPHGYYDCGVFYREIPVSEVK